MKKLTLSLIVMLGMLIVNAQDGNVKELKKESERVIKKDPADTVVRTWKTGGVFTLNLNQGSLTNWAAGGDEFSFSLNSYVNLYAFYKKGKHSWDNNLDLAYGIVNTTSLGSRKASDRIDLLSKYGYAVSKKWNVAFLANLRTQFSKGFAYSKTAFGTDTSAEISNFFAPAYVLLSVGFDYKPTNDLSIFISPATARFVIVLKDQLGPKYGVDPGKTVKSEFGAFLSVNYQKKIAKKFSYKTRLDLFSNYRHKPQNIDLFWSNVVTASITKYINFSFNLDIIYDDDTQNVKPGKGPAPQVLELMGIGFAYTFNRK
ncbi:MAG: DUF3078 domain-containing protein [Ferruginibacter sp.]